MGVLEMTCRRADCLPEPFEVTAKRSPRGRFEAVPYMAAFLGAARPRCRFTIVVATQTDDGRKFNRGRLMNAAFEV